MLREVSSARLGGGPSSQRATFWIVPPSVSQDCQSMSSRLLAAVAFIALSVPPALAQDRAKIEAGAEVYDMHCSTCHGERLRNTGAAFDLLQLKPNERARFDEAVKDAKGQMPPWAGVLSAEALDQIWAYIRSRADG